MRGFCLVIFLLVSSCLIAAPNQRRYEFDDIRAALADLQHEVGNQQTEARMFEEKLGTIDATLDAIRGDLISIKKQQKDKQTIASKDQEERIGNLDALTKGLVADVKALKNQLNETANALMQFKTRYSSLEKIIEGQNQNIEALQAALQAIAETFQLKEGIKPTKTYVVKSGDSLEKIARIHQMTIDDLKNLNGLTGTKIIIGQKLLVDEK